MKCELCDHDEAMTVIKYFGIQAYACKACVLKRRENARKCLAEMNKILKAAEPRWEPQTS